MQEVGGKNRKKRKYTHHLRKKRVMVFCMKYWRMYICGAARKFQEEYSGVGASMSFSLWSSSYSSHIRALCSLATRGGCWSTYDGNLPTHASDRFRICVLVLSSFTDTEIRTPFPPVLRSHHRTLREKT